MFFITTFMLAQLPLGSQAAIAHFILSLTYALEGPPLISTGQGTIFADLHSRALKSSSLSVLEKIGRSSYVLGSGTTSIKIPKLEAMGMTMHM